MNLGARGGEPACLFVGFRLISVVTTAPFVLLVGAGVPCTKKGYVEGPFVWDKTSGESIFSI